MKTLFLKGSKVPLKSWASELDSNVEEQLKNLASLPFIHKHVAVMPDAHLGIGASVGTVIPTIGAIIPSAVGVDIGCGMCAVPIPLADASKKQLLENPSFRKNLRSQIEAVIPVGNGREGEHKDGGEDSLSLRLLKQLGDLKAPFARGEELKKSQRQLGTLGGGNHFIEICRDTTGEYWAMLHSGSRHIGNRLAKYHIDEAKGLMKQTMIHLPDPDLAYLTQGTKEFKDYIHDLLWAQKYAKANRKLMMEKLLGIVIRALPLNTNPQQLMQKMIDCHHNYTEREQHFGQEVYVTRKGAVRALPGEWGIIPGSMGTKSFIVQGKGNAESFCSCSHGAGRKMGRNQAKRQFTLQDLKEQTQGVECRVDKQVLDEIPAAYKNIDEVMKNQEDLVEIRYELKQILCIKGG